MADGYTRHEWHVGEIITASKMNNIETGISEITDDIVLKSGSTMTGALTMQNTQIILRDQSAQDNEHNTHITVYSDTYKQFLNVRNLSGEYFRAYLVLNADNRMGFHESFSNTSTGTTFWLPAPAENTESATILTNINYGQYIDPSSAGAVPISGATPMTSSLKTPGIKIMDSTGATLFASISYNSNRLSIKQYYNNNENNYKEYRFPTAPTSTGTYQYDILTGQGGTLSGSLSGTYFYASSYYTTRDSNGWALSVENSSNERYALINANSSNYRWQFRSYKTAGGSSLYEMFRLPVPTITSGYAEYDILTTKTTIGIPQGGTGATTAEAARTALGAAAASHNHSASNITSGTLPITRGGTNAAARNTAMDNLINLGASPISSTTNDTVTNWVALRGGIAWYSTDGQLNGQLGQYGFLFNVSTSASTSNVHQLWFTQRDGNMAHRGGNNNGWANWRIILDSSNYTSYAAAANHTHPYAPENHASTSSAYGTADSTHYGHVKVTDTYNAMVSNSVPSSGALYNVYQIAVAGGNRFYYCGNWAATNTRSQNTWTLPSTGTWIIITGHNSTATLNGGWLIRASGDFNASLVVKIFGGTNISSIKYSSSGASTGSIGIEEMSSTSGSSVWGIYGWPWSSGSVSVNVYAIKIG